MESYSESMGRKYWEQTEKGKKSLNPHNKDETTTIEVTKEMRDYLKQFHGRNYTERIGSLDWKQNCAKAAEGCGEKADHALRLFLSEDLMVAIPLCTEHLKEAEVDNMEEVY